ncbi:MAG: sulfatase-like hydrolase/transferase [Bacteroidales bacterium]|nr:sulfatase-like hydrolase/transferase [Bacteroidales bacterium]
MAKKKNRIPNIYAYLLIKFLLAFFALLVAQAVFVIVNMDMCHVETSHDWWRLIWGNVVFGLATVSTAFLPYFVLMLIPTELRWKRWYRVICEIIYYAVLLLMIVPAFCDAIYYQHTLRLLSADIFHYLTVGGQMGTLTWMFLTDFWPVTLTGVVLLIVDLIIGVRMKLPERDSWRNHTANDWVGFAVCMILLAIMVRGGFGRYCLQLSDAAKYAEPKNTVLVSNSLYSVIRTMWTDELPKEDIMDRNEAMHHFSTDFRKTPIDSTLGCDGWRPGAGRYVSRVYAGDTLLSETERQKNVVVIVLESFSQEYMGCYGAEKSYTPFLDSLAKVCYLYNGRSNGKKSIEGIAAITGSIPTLTYTAYTLSDYYDSTAATLPSILHRHGYNTAFYHGTYNGVMNFDSYCRHAGFDNYYGKDEYMAEGIGSDADYDGAWGIFDEPFLRYTNGKMSATKEPFFSMIFTVTSHHPFPVPEQYKDVFKAAKGESPLLKCIRYTDYSLGQFFKAASKEEWFKNTLFVIMADHPGYVLSKPFSTLSGLYRIPVMIYDPSREFGQKSERIVQQPDVMPTILDYLGYKDRCVCFGSSVFRDEDGYQVAFGNGYYQLNTCDTVTATICGRYEEGREEDLNFLKAYLKQYRDVLKDRERAEK